MSALKASIPRDAAPSSRGADARDEGELSRQIAVLRPVSRDELPDPLGDYRVGMERYKIRRYDDAASAYRRAIELMEDYTATHRDLGKALRDAGRREEAIPARHRRGATDARRTDDEGDAGFPEAASGVAAELSAAPGGHSRVVGRREACDPAPKSHG